MSLLKQGRSHHCNALRKEHIGQDIVLMGWVQHHRDLGSIIFIDLMDREGVTQVTINSEKNPAAYQTGTTVRLGACIAIQGQVISRAASGGSTNHNLPTGEIEVIVSHIDVLSRTEPLPFTLDEEVDASELTRMKYRYLDIRRGPILRNLRLRSNIAYAVRNYFQGLGFVEVETPILMKSTPEGARDYLVPSRLERGHFYALPQSPQLYKQLLMMGGIDKYYQIARCFRDEDLRADRQPEFTQIDFELSFITREHIYTLVEGLFASLFKQAMGKEISTPFPRMSYKDTVEKYGEDRPDIRFGLELVDVGSVFARSELKIFQDIVTEGGKVKAILVPGEADKSRSWFKNLEKHAKQHWGVKGLAWFKYVDKAWDGPLVKSMSEQEKTHLASLVQAKEGDLLFIIADMDSNHVNVGLSNLRRYLYKALEYKPNMEWGLLWVEDFPLFEKDTTTGQLSAVNHAFTAPHPEDIDRLEREPTQVRSLSYDLVLNGFELGSGSIRIHQTELQAKVLNMLGFTREQAQDRFGFLLEALQFGPPPHGGMALGLDRIAMILAGESSLREVIAFPKTQKASCPMSGAPGTVDTAQLDELFLTIKPAPEKEPQKHDESTT